MLSVMILNVAILSVNKLSVVILSGNTLSVIMLSVVMQNVAAPPYYVDGSKQGKLSSCHSSK